jgi:hypothetical protein
MREIITTIMCLSFVTGLYEIVVEQEDFVQVRYTGGGFKCTKWLMRDSWSEHHSEEYIRSLISEEQWEELRQNDIIECRIVHP